MFYEHICWTFLYTEHKVTMQYKQHMLFNLKPVAM